MEASIQVEVAYVDPDHQFLCTVVINESATVADAIRESGLLDQIPSITIDKVGVFGKAVNIDDQLKSGDRVEVYRPLIFDPMEARRKRAAQKSQK